VSRIFHWGKTERPKAESGGGVLEERQQLPSPPARGLGDAVSSPAGFGAQRFSTIFSTQDDSVDTIILLDYHAL